jgi:hypothetical protein
LGGTGLDDSFIIDLLKHSSTPLVIKTLDLSYNNFTCVYVKRLLLAHKILPSLEMLNLNMSFNNESDISINPNSYSYPHLHTLLMTDR